ncbi:hypothetical protein FJZ36_09835 [Candidatus Poribacteria bacterium]|nr:hypothetical protein [Candidatus Poribacteria bacterium]
MVPYNLCQSSMDIHGATTDVTSAIEAARRAVMRYISADDRAVAAYVAGSAATGAWSESSDVDVRVVLTSQPLPPQAFVLEHGVPLEWKFLHISHLGSDEAVLRHPFRAPELAASVVLYDPSRWLCDLRNRIECSVAEPVCRRARATALLSAAHEALERVENAMLLSGTMAPWEFRCALFWSIEAPCALTGKPTTHRRGLVHAGQALKELGAEDLYELALEALGVSLWEPGQANECWRDLERVWLRADDAQHHYLARARIPYWASGISELIQTGLCREAGLPLWTLASLLWRATTPEDRAPVTRALGLLGMERPYGPARRCLAARRWLDALMSAVGAESSGSMSLDMDME